jgi:hypothetical protein
MGEDQEVLNALIVLKPHLKLRHSAHCKWIGISKLDPDNFNDPVNPGTVLSKVTIYSDNASISQNNMIDMHNIKEEIKLCNPPLFTPISLTSVCGQNVVITVQLQSNNPLGIEDTFNDDVICNSTPPCRALQLGSQVLPLLRKYY